MKPAAGGLCRQLAGQVVTGVRQGQRGLAEDVGLAAQIQVQTGARAVIGDPGHLRVQGGQVLQSFGFRGQARQIERRTERQFGIAVGEL